MNSRQRRGGILLVLSGVCALAAFAGVFTVINDVESKVGSEVTAYELNRDVPAYEELSASQFDRVRIPKRWLPDTAVTDLADVRGQIAATDLRKGSLLQRDMAADRPALAPGQREIAIMIDAETGVAGKINPGNAVDIFATFEGENGEKPSSQIIVSNAKVIDVGELKALDPDADSRRQSDEAVPITFALATIDAQRVAYAESFATHVRLALIAPGSDTSKPLPPSERTYRLDQDQ